MQEVCCDRPCSGLSRKRSRNGKPHHPAAQVRCRGPRGTCRRIVRQRQDLSIPILDLSGASRFETAVLSPTRAAPPARGVASELKGREALIVAFGASLEEHEKSHRRKTFQPMLRRVLEFCENGNEEIACETAWSGRAHSEDGWALLAVPATVAKSGKGETFCFLAPAGGTRLARGTVSRRPFQFRSASPARGIRVGHGSPQTGVYVRMGRIVASISNGRRIEACMSLRPAPGAIR